MLKILQDRLQKHMNKEIPDVQAAFRKGRETRDQIANIHWIIEKAREFQINICFVDYTKGFDCVDHNKLWKTVKEMGIPDHLTCTPVWTSLEAQIVKRLSKMQETRVQSLGWEDPLENKALKLHLYRTKVQWNITKKVLNSKI